MNDETPIGILADEAMHKASKVLLVDELNQAAVPKLIVNDKRAAALIDALPDPVPDKARPARMIPGEYYEINGVCYYVRKITDRDVVLRRFTGTLLVNKANATAVQIKNARSA